MTGDVPFGFTPRDGDPEDGSTGSGGGGSGVGGGSGGGGGGSAGGGLPFGLGGPGDPGSFDLGQLGAALQQLGAMLQSGGGEDGPVDWASATRLARQQLSSEGDPAVSDADRSRVAEAVRLADLWLDPVTAFPATTGGATAWSRSEWLEATLPAWRRIVEPVAASVQGAMGGMGLLPGDATGLPGLPEGLPPELAAMAGPLMGMARRMGSLVFGMQVGQGLATLAGEVLGAADVGIPLTDDGRAALLPRNVEEFGAGLGVAADDVRLYLALREVAHQRLFTHVPWLRSRLLAAVEQYAAGVRVDTDRVEEAMRGIDPNNPEAIQEVLSSGVFEPEDTPEQKAALARLEALLALVEGWVDDVVDAAAGERLPAASALRESVRRRRAIGGPAEKTFATLVGLELRPRRLREAAALWTQVRGERGVEGRDSLWGHPDLLPTADDLDDPAGFLARSVPLDLAAIEAELGEDLDGDGVVGGTDDTGSPDDHRQSRRRVTGRSEERAGDGSDRSRVDRVHADAVRVVGDFDPGDDPAQRSLRGRFLTHLAAHPDALSRTCLSGHLTASALVVGDDGRVLLMLHAKAGRWLQMGGHVEAADATLRDAAAREAREESGIDGLELSPGPVRLDWHEGPCHPSRPPHLDVQFLARAPARAQPTGSAESHDLAWFDVDALPGDPPDAAVADLVRLARLPTTR